MQEGWNEWQAVLEEMKTMKKREYFLTMAVCILSGLVLGMLMSPQKRVTIGSHNGNNNSSCCNDEGDWNECCDGDECCCGDECGCHEAE